MKKPSPLIATLVETLVESGSPLMVFVSFEKAFTEPATSLR